MEIETYANYGRQMMVFTLSLGELFKELHRNSNLTLGEPEPNHFSINYFNIDKNVDDDLANAIRCSILQELPETKGKEALHTNVVDYHFNKIFAPFFEISYLKKRKLELSNEFIKSLMSEDETVAGEAVKKYLQDYWKNKSSITDPTEYEQMTFLNKG